MPSNKGLILSLDAEPKTYKTSILLTLPLPAVVLCYDPGWERAIYGTKGPELLKGVDWHVAEYQNRADLIYPLFQQHDLVIVECPLPIQETFTRNVGFKAVFDYSQMIAGHVLRSLPNHAIAVDTATLMRTFSADAYLEGEQKNKPGKQNLGQIEYGKPNDRVRYFYNQVKASRKNAIVTHHLTDEYVKQTGPDGVVESVKSGKRIPEGAIDRDKYIDAALTLSNKGTPKEPKVTATFTLCGFAENLIGTSIENPTWNRIVGSIQIAIEDRLEFTRRV